MDAQLRKKLGMTHPFAVVKWVEAIFAVARYDADVPTVQKWTRVRGWT
jgi:hypothetical protein